MRVTWQINPEWWGRNAVAHHEDYTLTIQEMDGKSFWWIRKDQSMQAKGIFPMPIEKAQPLIASRLLNIKTRRKHASAA